MEKQQSISSRNKSLIISAIVVVIVLVSTIYFAAEEGLISKTPETSVKSGDLAVKAVSREANPVTQTDTSALNTQQESDSKPRKIDPLSEEALIDGGFETLERMRKLPGAAPLVDEIVAYLQNDTNDEASPDNIPVDEDGLAVLNDGSLKAMVRNEEIREKWSKLMQLVAEHPEVMEKALKKE